MLNVTSFLSGVKHCVIDILVCKTLLSDGNVLL